MYTSSMKKSHPNRREKKKRLTKHSEELPWDQVPVPPARLGTSLFDVNIHIVRRLCSKRVYNPQDATENFREEKIKIKMT